MSTEQNTPDRAAIFINDISSKVAEAAYYGVSFNSERRGQTMRTDYANTLAADYETLRVQAERGGTLDLLDEEFARYRAGFAARTRAYLHSNSRCVSWFIAGPSNFPAARMAKRSEIAHRRLNEMLEYRGRALAAIKRTLRPDLRAIYAGDGDAIERLEAKITAAEASQQRMKATNAAIRKNAKTGAQAQVAALLGLGFTELQAAELLKPDFCGRIGFADYQLTNNNANIRRMKERLEQITKAQATPATVIEGANARLEDDPPANRVRLFFPGKPAVEIRERLKGGGFRWARSIGAWQAYRNYRTLALAAEIAGKPAPAAAEEAAA